MDILLKPPVPPMLAKRVEAIPKDGSWIFEPKWDGFRSIIFRDKDEVFIQSRDGKPLNRYFPELIDPLRQQLPLRYVLDGEIVIATPQGLDFDALQLRLHPAESRVKLLAKQTPASVVFFDLLYQDHKDLMSEPFAKRRRLLEEVLRSAKPPLHITPSTTEPSTAEDWFQRFEGAGLDGVIAKAAEGQYEPDKRVMLKLKNMSVTATALWRVSAGIKLPQMRWARSCSGSTTIEAHCSTSVSAPTSPCRSAANWSNFSPPIAGMR